MPISEDYTSTYTPPTTKALTAADNAWAIDYNEFDKKISGLTKQQQPDGTWTWNNQDGSIVPLDFNLANGKKWTPSGASNQITFVPKGTMVGAVQGSSGGDGGNAVEANPGVASTEDRWIVGGDASAMNGTPDSNQHVTVTYHKVGGKLEPVAPVENWQWQSPYSGVMDMVKFVATAVALYTGVAALGEMAAGSATAGEVASTAVNNPSAWTAGGSAGGAGGAMTATESAAFAQSSFRASEIAAQNLAEQTVTQTAGDMFLPDVGNLAQQSFRAGKIAAQTAGEGMLDSAGLPVMPDVQGITPDVMPDVTPKTIADPSAADITSAPKTNPMAQETFRAGELSFQNNPFNASALTPAANGVIDGLIDAAKKFGGTVTDWIKANPTSATLLFSAVSGAITSKSAVDAAAALAQSKLDQINLVHDNQLADNARFSASVTGLKKPGLINQTPLKRLNGTNVFQPNGLLNSQGTV